MRLIIFLQGKRGKTTLLRLQTETRGYEIVGIVYEKGASDSFYSGECHKEDENLRGLPVFYLDGLSASDGVVIDWLQACCADVFVLAGCRHILDSNVLSIPSLGTIGLHGGKLPEYRGSSPLNWALIRGCHAHSLSVIEVGLGIDTGRVIQERTLPIAVEETIVDLHERAQKVYPEMVVCALELIKDGCFSLQKPSQNEDQEGVLLPKNSSGNYFSRRFPNDGFINWHSMGAWEVHNTIRALTKPYPCAKTSYRGKIWNLEASRLSVENLIGNPGRIYGIKGEWLQVATKDRGIWIRAEKGLAKTVQRYDVLSDA